MNIKKLLMMSFMGICALNFAQSSNEIDSSYNSTHGIKRGLPIILWGGTFNKTDTIRISRFEIGKLKTIKAKNPLSSSPVEYWPIHLIQMAIPNFESRSTHNSLNDEMLSILSKTTQPTLVRFALHYEGPDHIRRLFHFEKVLIIE